jgi:hypothetical protein
MCVFAGAASAQGGPLRASLTGYQEVPSVSSRADGEFEARVNANGTVDYSLAYAGLQGSVTMAHIHFAQKGVNGPIIIWLCGTGSAPNTVGPAGTPTCPASGTVTGSFTAANVAASPSTQQLAANDLGALVAAMRAGAAYVNVHSSISPGGEIRGQVTDNGAAGGATR